MQTYQQKESARVRNMWKRIQDGRIPDHHLSTVERNCRRKFDAQGEPTHENPIVTHSILPSPAFTAIQLKRHGYIIQKYGPGCWQNRFYPNGVGEHGIHPDKYKFNRRVW